MRRIALVGTTHNGLLAGISRTDTALVCSLALPSTHPWCGTGAPKLNTYGVLPVSIDHAWSDDIGMWRLDFSLPKEQTTTDAIMFLDEIAALVVRVGGAACA